MLHALLVVAPVHNKKYCLRRGAGGVEYVLRRHKYINRTKKKICMSRLGSYYLDLNAFEVTCCRSEEREKEDLERY